MLVWTLMIIISRIPKTRVTLDSCPHWLSRLVLIQFKHPETSLFNLDQLLFDRLKEFDTDQLLTDGPEFCGILLSTPSISIGRIPHCTFKYFPQTDLIYYGRKIIGDLTVR